MKLAVPREIRDGERRVGLAPESCKKLVQAGVAVAVESNAGAAACFSDAAYRDAGATVEADVVKLLGDADLVIKVQPPQMNAATQRHEIELLRNGAILACVLRPTVNLDTVRRLVAGRISCFAMDCVPRTTRAQSMDVLSSQATVAGYKAALLAADELAKFFPMFMTAAGTVLAAKVLVIGAGVAGLQAIATARRLGAVVEAFDTRPVVKEEVESLGARFVALDVAHGEAQDAGGYAKQLADDVYRREMELIAEHAANADAVITTALIGGVKAPRLISADTVRRMRPGSVIVDLAAEGGGNCELTEPGRIVVHNGVRICGPTNLPAEMPLHASLLYSRNLATFVLELWKDGRFNVDLSDDIVRGALVTHEGELRHEPTSKALLASEAAK